MNDKLGDKESKEGIRRILWLVHWRSKCWYYNFKFFEKNIERIRRKNMSDEKLKDMLERASKNGVELKFEEFYDI